MNSTPTWGDGKNGTCERTVMSKAPFSHAVTLSDAKSTFAARAP